MPAAMFILLGCQLAGEVVRAAFHLPIPGPVIGMFLLAAALAWRGRGGVGDERVGMSPERAVGVTPLERGADVTRLERVSHATPLEPASQATSLERASHTTPLERTADALISHMGLLFVPAGVGVIAEVGVLQTQWFPTLAALVGSTMLSLMVTGLVMHWVGRATEARSAPMRVGQARLEVRP